MIALFVFKKKGWVWGTCLDTPTTVSWEWDAHLWTQSPTSHTILATMFGAVIQGWIDQCPWKEREVNHSPSKLFLRTGRLQNKCPHFFVLQRKIFNLIHPKNLSCKTRKTNQLKNKLMNINKRKLFLAIFLIHFWYAKSYHSKQIYLSFAIFKNYS